MTTHLTFDQQLEIAKGRIKWLEERVAMLTKRRHETLILEGEIHQEMHDRAEIKFGDEEFMRDCNYSTYEECLKDAAQDIKDGVNSQGNLYHDWFIKSDGRKVSDVKCAVNKVLKDHTA